jgi:CRP-like cAMP-binding protein
MSKVSSSGERSQSRNKLLSTLSDDDFTLLQPHLQRVTLPLRQDLERPNRRIEAVYFMDAGIASIVALQSDGTRVEVGLVGWEGMSGIAVVLDSGTSPHSTYMQVAGVGQRMPSKELRKGMDVSASLRSLLLRYAQVFGVQTAHTAIANARARLDQRLARWILMAHDRTRDPTLALTHEFLSLMLGVRRAGVTEALQSLTRQELIETGRNQIIVHNREGLERKAGPSYGVPEKEYRRLIG